jgi:hypothetical protein
MPDLRVPWWPQPRQASLLEAAGVQGCLTGGRPSPPRARVIGYGGAAGGGKSDGLLGLGITWAAAFPGASIGYFRRTFPELEGPDGAILRSQEILAEMRAGGGCEWHGKNHRWRFAWGSILQFCHCKDPKDVYNYQSQSFDLLLIDEATHFLWTMVDYLMTRNRPTVDSVLAPLAAWGTNPGNVGHLWFKSQFVDVRPWETPHPVELPSGERETHVFLPAKLEDNPILDRRADGAYRKTLLLRDPITRRALLDMDWNVFVGQVFKEWREARHVRPPVALPYHWPAWRSVDWGFVAPFCCGWFRRDPDIGRVYVYRELYETGLTDRQQARLIAANSPPVEKVRITYADPSMWTRKTHEDKTFSTADEYRVEGVLLTEADNDRLTGVRKVHSLLADLPDGEPGLVIFESCPNLIRTLPALVHSATQPEDVDTDGEDHGFDMLKYALTNVKPPVQPRVIRQLVADPVVRRARQLAGSGLGSKDL